MAGWDRWFKLDWSVAPESGGGQRITGFVTNQSGETAVEVRVLGQALDASSSVVGQQIAWVPGGVNSGARRYFEIPRLPRADHYRVSVWDYSFRQADSDRE